MNVIESASRVIAERGLAGADTPVLLMVSGGSDSTALAYIARCLHMRGSLGQLAMLHVNHKLRGAAADGDAAFVGMLASQLQIPLFNCDINISALAKAEGGNIEAIARRERYKAAREALESLCRYAGVPVSEGRIFAAHTADDRVENFYMRSIVGTGPGGFRSMLYLNGQVARPLLEVGRQDLRDFLQNAAGGSVPDLPAQLVVRDEVGALWREDATNEHTDRFRAFVRANVVPRAKERNPKLLETLTRTMNLIADEDDMLAAMTDDLMARLVEWVQQVPGIAPDYDAGCSIAPEIAQQPLPLQRRMATRVLTLMLGADARVETASVDAVLAAIEPAVDGSPARIKGGYVANIQGDIAVSANKRGIRLEPMLAFRARRNRL